MTEPTGDFRTVLRGYDPSQVHARLRQLTASLGSARQEAETLQERVRSLEAQAQEEQPEPEPQTPPTFEHLGNRVGQILSLAEEEADEIRRRVLEELQEHRQQVSETVERLRAEADRYAEQRRSEADTEATRVLEDARRTAEDRID